MKSNLINFKSFEDNVIKPQLINPKITPPIEAHLSTGILHFSLASFPFSKNTSLIHNNLSLNRSPVNSLSNSLFLSHNIARFS